MLKKWMSFSLIIAILTVPQPGVWGVSLVYADPPPLRLLPRHPRPRRHRSSTSHRRMG
jgi:hypothetical protein